MIAAFQRKLVSPKGTQEGEKNLPSSSHQTTYPHPLVSLKETQDLKTKDTGPGIIDAFFNCGAGEDS